MPRAKPAKKQPVGVYVREIMLSLRNNSGAYGYSVMITCVLAMLSALHSTPDPGQIFLFILGAGLSFLFLESMATKGFQRSLSADETTRVVALGTSFSALSISAGVGAAALLGLVLPVTLAWFAGSFAGSVVYLLLAALEMEIARRIEEARDVE